MNRLLFSITVLLLLAFAHAQNNRKKTERDHIAEIKPHKKGDLPPNVRKCMNVKCAPEQQCFHGKCIKYDALCATIRCAAGYRCKNGECIQQLHSPKKMLCTPLAFKSEKKQCTEQLLTQCRQIKLTSNQEVCGFNKKNRKFFDYRSACEACQDNICDIDFYYQVSCDAAPRICSQDEECMNGLCTAEFKDKIFENYRACNDKIDCKPLEECAFHKCVNRNVLFSFLGSKSEEQSILVKI